MAAALSCRMPSWAWLLSLVRPDAFVGVVVVFGEVVYSRDDPLLYGVNLFIYLQQNFRVRFTVR
jgi:hypothetical protein